MNYVKSRDWVLANQMLLGTVFIALNGLAILADLLMVLVLGVDSISWRTWVATQLHPTLIAAGLLGTIWVCWLVRSSWVRVFFGALMGGHLFLHW